MAAFPVWDATFADIAKVRFPPQTYCETLAAHLKTNIGSQLSAIPARKPSATAWSSSSTAKMSSALRRHCPLHLWRPNEGYTFANVFVGPSGALQRGYIRTPLI